MMRYIIPFFALCCVFAAPLSANAAGDAVEPPDIEWGFEGPFGTFDRAALQRGFQVYSQVCAACHSMNQLSYRNLDALGYSEGQIKTIAAQYSMMDGPNDEGEMEERPMRPSDVFKNPFENKQQAQFANNGAMPPDLSLIVKARHNGANYLYGLMTGYKEAPEGKELLAGQYWNKYMPGHVIAMAPPLSDGMLAYEDGSDETVDQYSRDLVEFMTWAASPEMEERKQIGLKVLLFLLVFAGIMYAVKRKIWANAH